MRLERLFVLLALLATPALAATMQDLADCGVVGDYDAQIAACTRVIDDKATPEHERAIALFNRGSVYDTKGQYDEALADYNVLLRARPVALVYANRGFVRQKLHDYDHSIADLTEALRLDPALAQAHKWRGVSYVNIGDNKRALADFDAALRLDPTDDEVHWQRGRTYEIVRNYKAALADYTVYLEHDRTWVPGYIRRATVFLALGDPDHALADASDAMYIEPRNVAALTVRGNAYRAKRDFTRALDDYTAAIDFDRDAAIYYERGVAYRMKGERDNAITDFKMAIRLQPKDSDAARAELKALGIEAPPFDPKAAPNAKAIMEWLK
jgi:tetratricopeptide (TPR) repeat protein